MLGLAHIGWLQELAPKSPGMGTAASGSDGVLAGSSHLYLNNLRNQGGHSFTFLALKQGASRGNLLVLGEGPGSERCTWCMVHGAVSWPRSELHPAPAAEEHVQGSCSA